jgi:hypothetical protein
MSQQERADLKPDPGEVADEQRRMRLLRMMVDVTAAVLRHRPLSRAEADHVVEDLRGKVLELFPGKDFEFDLIYRERFRRIIGERFGGEESSVKSAPS